MYLNDVFSLRLRSQIYIYIYIYIHAYTVNRQVYAQWHYSTKKKTHQYAPIFRLRNYNTEVHMSTVYLPVLSIVGIVS
jgi:hypothetical protein